MNNHARNQTMTSLRKGSNLMRMGLMYPNNRHTVQIYHLQRRAGDHMIFSKPLYQTSLTLNEGMDTPPLDVMIYLPSGDQTPIQPTPFTTTQDEGPSSHSYVTRCLTIGSIIPIYQMPGLPLEIFNIGGSKL